MRAFIFGAGASVHADYPLARDLGHELLQWAESHPQSEWDYPLDPREFVPLFPCLDDFEEIVSELESPTLSKIMALPKWGSSGEFVGNFEPGWHPSFGQAADRSSVQWLCQLTRILFFS